MPATGEHKVSNVKCFFLKLYHCFRHSHVIELFVKFNSKSNFQKMISIASINNHAQSGFRNLKFFDMFMDL